MRDFTSFDHRLGFRGILLALEPEPAISRRTPAKPIVAPKPPPVVMNATARDLDGMCITTSGSTLADGEIADQPAQAEPQFKVGDTVHYQNSTGVRTDYTGEVIDNKPNERGLIGVRWKLPSGKISEQRQPPSCLVPAKAKAEPQPDADGWIEHDGKGMPVSPSTHVMVRLRGGRVFAGEKAGYWHEENPKHSNWVHSGSSADIMAYRVVPA